MLTRAQQNGDNTCSRCFMLAYLFVVLAVAIRVVAGTGTFATHGFTPVGASLLFFGSRMPRKYFWVPVALLIGSDLFLNYRVYHLPLTWDQTIVWAWYAVACGLGMLLSNRVKPLYVAGAALASSVSFFLISNFAVWLAGYIVYPKTFAGLISCYVAAIPFFQRGLASDLFFSAVFFGLGALVAHATRTMPQRDLAA
jgi:hypothetical protein